MTPLTLSLRQRKLVHYLQLQSAYTTGQELASQLQVSARTIRNDIAEINQIFAIMSSDEFKKGKKSSPLFEEGLNVTINCWVLSASHSFV